MEDKTLKENFKTKNTFKNFLRKKAKIAARIFLYSKKLQHM